MSKSEFLQKTLALQSQEQISQQLFSLKKQLFGLRFQKTLGELPKTSAFSVVKKNIARLKTELSKRLRVGE